MQSQLPPVFVAEHAAQLASVLHAAMLVTPPSKEASDLLREAESRPGFCLVLLRDIAFARASSPPNLRMAAILVAKQVVARRWPGEREARARMRLLAANPENRELQIMSTEEKTAVRECLFGILDEPDGRVAENLHPIFAHIVRRDWPAQWSDVFRRLAGAAQHGAGEQPSRAWALLYAAVKELSKVTLPVGRHRFQALAKELVPFVHGAWHGLAEAATRGLEACVGPADVATLKSCLASLLLTSKLLCVLVSRVFALLSQDASVQSLLGSAIPALFERLLGARRALRGARADSDLKQSLDKVIKRLGRLFEESQRRASLEFAPYVPVYLRMCLGYLQSAAQWSAGVVRAAAEHGFSEAALERAERISSEAPDAPHKALALSCVHLIESCIGSDAYVPTSGDAVGSSGPVAHSPPQSLRVGAAGAPLPADETRRLGAIGHEALAAFLSGDGLRRLMHILFQLMLPTASDLSSWVEEPEELITAELQATRDFSLAHACEYCLLALLDKHQEAAAATLVALLQESEAQPLASVTPWLALYRDALYRVAGLSSYALRGRLPFQSWFDASLGPLLKAAAAPSTAGGPAALPLFIRVLQRRAVWMVSCFSADIAEDGGGYGRVFEAVAAVLQTPDLVVRLAAAEAVEHLVGAWTFALPQFLPFFPPIVQALLATLTRAGELSIRASLIGTIKTITQRCAPELHRYAAALVAPLPDVWRSFAPSDPVRASVLDVVAHAADAMRARCSEAVLPHALPMVAEALAVVLQAPEAAGTASWGGRCAGAKPHADGDDTLAEATLLCWRALVRNASAYVPELHRLFPALPALASRALGLAGPALELLESYVLLGGATLMGEHAGAVQAMLDQLQRDVASALVPALSRACELLVRCFPAQSPPLLDGLLVRAAGACFSTIAARERAEGVRKAVTERAAAAAAGAGGAVPGAPVLLAGGALSAEDVAAIRAALPPDVEAPASVHAYLTLLARVTVESPAFLAQWAPRAGAAFGLQGAAAGPGMAHLLARAMLHQWRPLGRSTSTPWRRKLWLLAMLHYTCLAPDAEGLGLLPQIVEAAGAFLQDLAETEHLIAPRGMPASEAARLNRQAQLYVPGAGMDDDDGDTGAGTGGGTPESRRRLAAFERCPSQLGDARQAIARALKAVEAAAGPALHQVSSHLSRAAMDEIFADG